MTNHSFAIDVLQNRRKDTRMNEEFNEFTAKKENDLTEAIEALVND